MNEKSLKMTSENHVTGRRKEEEVERKRRMREKNETAFTIPQTEFCLVMSGGQVG